MEKINEQNEDFEALSLRKNKYINCGENLNANDKKIKMHKETVKNYIRFKRFVVPTKELRKNAENNSEILFYDLNIDNLNIPPEYKNSQKQLEMTHLKTNEPIFDFINEIFNNNNFNEDRLKFGVYLLNLKLMCESEDFIDVSDILERNFSEIIVKIFSFCKTILSSQLPKNYFFLKSIYCILINFTYYAKQNQMSFLLTDQMLSFHLFFFKYCDNNSIVYDISTFLSNLISNNFYGGKVLFEFNNGEFLSVLDDYIESGIKCGKRENVRKYWIIYENYLINVSNNNFPLLPSIPSRISNLLSLSITAFSNHLFSDLIFILNLLYKTLLKEKKTVELSQCISCFNLTEEVFETIVNYEFNEHTEDIEDVCGYIESILICEEELKKNNKKTETENELVEEMDKCIYTSFCKGIVNKLVILLEKKFSREITVKLIECLTMINDCLLVSDFIFKNIYCPTEVIAKFIESPKTDIKKKALIFVKSFLRFNGLKAANLLMSIEILSVLLDLLRGQNIYLIDDEVVLITLEIISDLLTKCDSICRKFKKTNNVYLTILKLGGKDTIINCVNLYSK